MSKHASSFTLAMMPLTRQGIRDCNGPEFAGLAGKFAEDVPDDRPGRPRRTVSERNFWYRQGKRLERNAQVKHLRGLAYLRTQTGLRQMKRRVDPQYKPYDHQREALHLANHDPVLDFFA